MRERESERASVCVSCLSTDAALIYIKLIKEKKLALLFKSTGQAPKMPDPSIPIMQFNNI